MDLKLLDVYFLLIYYCFDKNCKTHPMGVKPIYLKNILDKYESKKKFK
jgi:hypothetical protein